MSYPKTKNQKRLMDDIYYEPIKEDDPEEQLLEAIRRIARAEVLRQVEQRLSVEIIVCLRRKKGDTWTEEISWLEERSIVVGREKYRGWKRVVFLQTPYLQHRFHHISTTEYIRYIQITPEGAPECG